MFGPRKDSNSVPRQTEWTWRLPKVLFLRRLYELILGTNISLRISVDNLLWILNIHVKQMTCFYVKRNTGRKWTNVYLLLGSEPLLSKSKEFFNQGIKIQVKRVFKIFFFGTKKYKWKCTAGASTPLPPSFKINASLILSTPLFQRISQPLRSGSTKWWTTIVSITTLVFKGWEASRFLIDVGGTV